MTRIEFWPANTGIHIVRIDSQRNIRQVAVWSLRCVERVRAALGAAK
jgi:hypothetical protein